MNTKFKKIISLYAIAIFVVMAFGGLTADASEVTGSISSSANSSSSQSGNVGGSVAGGSSVSGIIGGGGSSGSSVSGTVGGSGSGGSSISGAVGGSGNSGGTGGSGGSNISGTVVTGGSTNNGGSVLGASTIVPTPGLPNTGFHPIDKNGGFVNLMASMILAILALLGINFMQRKLLSKY